MKIAWEVIGETVRLMKLMENNTQTVCFHIISFLMANLMNWHIGFVGSYVNKQQQGAGSHRICLQGREKDSIKI